MLRFALILAALPTLAACEIDLTGLGDSLCWSYCGPPIPRVQVSGEVHVGPYLAEWEEATVLLYAAGDTVVARDSVRVSGGHYYLDLGHDPLPGVCDHTARAVKWTGERTERTRLFVGACGATPYFSTGPSFDLPDYTPLDQPFEVWGNVRIDGRPARVGEVTVRLGRRSTAAGPGWEHIDTDGGGQFRYSTTSGAERFSFCSYAEASVGTGVSGTVTSLSLPAERVCGDDRRLPDLRLGTRKAAAGWAYREAPSPAPVGAGEVRIALLSPADSSVVGEVFETYDDGSFHVWFPHDLQDPGCDWLLRAELSGVTRIQPLLPSGTPCMAELFHSFSF